MSRNELDMEFDGASFWFRMREGPVWVFVRWLYPRAGLAMFLANTDHHKAYTDYPVTFYDYDLNRCTPANEAGERLLAFAWQVAMLAQAK